ncbi:hypothetical protein BGZ81_007931 [Podila clonocystis]|nr:hypothetical protein BGZ81_007931 [Podila clonocystis]
MGVAEQTPSPPPASLEEPLTLFCIMEGQRTNRAFCVKPSPSDTVHDLRCLIKAAKEPSLDHVLADKLNLFRMTISDDASSSSISPIQPTHAHSSMLLRPTQVLSDVFGSRAAPNAIHIVVQRPPAAPADRTAMWYFLAHFLIVGAAVVYLAINGKFT